MPRDGAQTGHRHRADRHSPPHPVPLRHGTGASTYRSAGALALAALTVIATVRAPLRLSRTTDLDHRHVDSTFAQTREWVSTRSADGSGVVVNVTDFYDQAWLAYELRRLDDVGYVSLFPDYLRARSFEGAGEPRWAVIDSGRGEIIGAEPGCGPIEENSRFALIDAVACPASLQVG